MGSTLSLVGSDRFGFEPTRPRHFGHMPPRETLALPRYSSRQSRLFAAGPGDAEPWGMVIDITAYLHRLALGEAAERVAAVRGEARRPIGKSACHPTDAELARVTGLPATADVHVLAMTARAMLWG